MDMLKIGILGIAGILMALFIKDVKPQFAAFISIATCVLIFFFAITKLEFLTQTLATIKDYIALKDSYLSILLKIIGITYIADFSSNVCKDAGYQAIAGQIEIFGKISIFVVSAPVLMALLDTIQEFMS